MDYLTILAIAINFIWAYWMYFWSRRVKNKTLSAICFGIGGLNFLGAILLFSQIL